MMSVSVAEIPKNRCRTTTAEPMEANACETALSRGSHRLFRPRPGRPKRTYTSPKAVADRRAGKLGRLDPKTGKSDLIALGPGAAPHGVIVGPDGAAWVTEGGQNAIARVDPVTRAVKLFPLPKERGAANLNT